MTLSKNLLLLTASSALLLAAPPSSDQPWKDTKAAEWTEEDTKLILSESPWAKKVTPILNQDMSSRPSMGRGGMGGGGMGYPRRGGYPGGGYPGGGYPGGGYPGGGGGYPGGGGGYPGGGRGGNYPPNDRNPNDQSDDDDRRRRNEPKEVTLRWESAEPIQQALLKSKASDAPVMNSKEYAIVVSGLPRRMGRSGSNSNVFDEKALKGKAFLKKDSNKKIKASNVKVIRLEDSVTVVFFFPRKEEITLKDRLIEFDAKIGMYEIDRPFVLSEMMFDGRLSL
jgi:hypothetical protein